MTEPMEREYEILVYHRPREQSHVLKQAVRGLGHAVKSSTQLDQAVSLLEEMQHPIVVAYLGTDEESSVTTAKEYLLEKGLANYPVVIVGYKVDEIEGVFESYVPMVVPVRTPFNRQDLFEAVARVTGMYGEILAKLEKRRERQRQAQEAKKEVVSDTCEEDKREQARVDLTMELAYELEEIPKALFEQLARFDLKDPSLQGHLYAEKIGKDFLSAQKAMPGDPQLLAAIEQMLAESKDWPKAHLCRVSFVASQIFGLLGLDEEFKEQAKAAAFLYFWCLINEADDVQKYNYLEEDEDSVALKKLISSKIKDSAYHVAVTMKRPEIGDIISKLSHLVANDEPPTDDPICRAASAILAADLIDRVCFRAGHWDSRGAYQLMRKFKSGYMRGVHSKVWGCTIKFLSEAIASRNSSFQLLPKDLRKDPEKVKSLLSARSIPLVDGETRVPIASLSPGMRLSKPLVAFDGKQVLDNDILLDQDLVWRIWQLAAVRPLNSPIVWESEEAEMLYSSAISGENGLPNGDHPDRAAEESLEAVAPPPMPRKAPPPGDEDAERPLKRR